MEDFRASVTSLGLCLLTEFVADISIGVILQIKLSALNAT